MYYYDFLVHDALNTISTIHSKNMQKQKAFHNLSHLSPPRKLKA